MKNTAVLLISCPDTKGIVASVADFLYRNNANILHTDEHQDAEFDLFFLRTEWDLSDFALSSEEFDKQFTPIAEQFDMDWHVKYSAHTPKLALLVSKKEHCLADLLQRHRSQELQCDIDLVISNHPNARELAEFYGSAFYEVAEADKPAAEQKILALLAEHAVDVVVMARYMQILSAEFIAHFGKPIINIHHSFLPAFIGAKPYHQAQQRGVKIIGASAHYATADLDQGPIIEQDVLRVSHQDSVADLVRKGEDIERIVLSRAVKWHLDNRILTYANKTVVFD